ncbi:MAG: response regulator [bacterium]
MRKGQSEIIFNVLKHHFPKAPDSKLLELSLKLQGNRKIDKTRQEMASTKEGEKIMSAKLLFVDDDHKLVQVATRYLNQLRPEWEYLLAHSLAEARRIYNRYCPDAAVLDVSLPDGNGLDLLSEFKQHRPDLPIIVISGDDPVTISQAVIERGGYSFLEKPFSASLLVSQIEAAFTNYQDRAPIQAEKPPENGTDWKKPHALALRSEEKKIKPYDSPRVKHFVLK